MYFRRSLAGPTDWQWSYDTFVWYNTDDLAQVGGCSNQGVLVAAVSGACFMYSPPLQ